MPRKTTGVYDNPVPGTEENEGWVKGTVIIDTVGYIGQHLYEIAKDQEEFVSYITSYDFNLDELRDLLDINRVDNLHCISEEKPSSDMIRKEIKTRKIAYKKIFDRFEEEKKKRENPDLDESVANMSVETYNKDWTWNTKTIVYYPHPADRKFVIDNSPSVRKLVLLEQEIKKLQATIANTKETETSYVIAAASTPIKPVKETENLTPRKVAVKVVTPNEITAEDLHAKLNNELEKYDFRVEALNESSRNSNFRVVCEKWAKSCDLCDSIIWNNLGLNCRSWRGPIQDLKLKTKIRRLLKGLDSKTTETEIREKVKTMYNENVKITVENFVFPKQKDKSVKNFVVQIETTDSSFLTDEITKYCLNRNVKIRPWKGKVPTPLKSLPTFT